MGLRRKSHPNRDHLLMGSHKRESNLTIVMYIQIKIRMEVKVRRKTYMVRKVRRKKMMTKRSLNKANRLRNPLLINLPLVRSLKNKFRTI
jgi:hypothetical protein